MHTSEPTRLHLPRLPVFGWAAFAGIKSATLPCVIDFSNVSFTRSGRAAIALALRELAIGRGDGVLVPTYHCPTMIAPVVAAGAKPVFFPIDDTGAPALEELSQKDLSGVRAIITAHYFGLPQPMAGIRTFCDERGIALIEDCAHAMFGFSDGQPVGSWGDYAIASLTKFFPVTDGGCLVSKNWPVGAMSLRRPSFTSEIKALIDTLEIGARHGRLPGINSLIRGFLSAAATLRRVPESNIATPNGQGAEYVSADRWLVDFTKDGVAWTLPSRSSQWISRRVHRERVVHQRRHNYARLTQLLSALPGTKLVQPHLPPEAAPYVFPLWVEQAEAIYQRLRASGVPVFRWDEVWPGTPYIESDRGHDWATHLFQLGCHQDLHDQDLIRMADTLHRLSI